MSTISPADAAESPPAATPPVTTRRVQGPGGALHVIDQAGTEAPIVLLRSETSPDDVPGMAVSAGVITATGGLVSHAAVVARGWGLPAVVGVGSLVIDGTGARTADGVHRIAAGDAITLDGTTGEVWLGGDPDSADAEPSDVNAILADALPELLRLEEWTAKATD